MCMEAANHDICLGVLGDTTKNLSQNSQSPNRDPKLKPSEHLPRMLSTGPRRSVAAPYIYNTFAKECTRLSFVPELRVRRTDYTNLHGQL